MRPVYASLIALLAGVLTGVLAAWLVVVPPFWAVVLAVPVAACTLLATLLAGVAAPTWQPMPTPDESLAIHQAGTLSSRFAESAKHHDRFQVRVQPRLRKLALSALRQRPGLHDVTSLDDKRARHALGHELYILLTSRDARLPSPHRLAELVNLLEGK